MRSFIELTRLKIREVDPSAASPAPEAKSSAQDSPSKPVKPTPARLSDEEETALLHTTQLQALIRRSKLPALISYLTTNSLSPDFRFYPSDTQQNHHAPTLLHLAAAQNSATLVTGLLVRGGANPGITTAEGRVPFELAGDRVTRDAFRVARSELGESKWDWETAKVPAALSKEEATKRDERDRTENETKEAERRKAEEERLRVQGPKVDKATKAGGILGANAAKKTAQEKREDEAKGLTPEQKMRLDRERRARAAEERIRRMQAGSS
jgi:hypothetical protein